MRKISYSEKSVRFDLFFTQLTSKKFKDVFVLYQCVLDILNEYSDKFRIVNFSLLSEKVACLSVRVSNDSNLDMLTSEFRSFYKSHDGYFLSL